MNDDVDNVPLDDPQALEMGHLMVMTQATPFNGIARIYAPRYRQAALHVFDGDETALQAPMNRAYQDVRHAFAHYVRHDNDGRPFFLVGHSQGSNHGLRLLIEVIEGTPLAARLVAAYLPGMPTPRAVFDRRAAGIPYAPARRRPDAPQCGACSPRATAISKAGRRSTISGTRAPAGGVQQRACRSSTSIPWWRDDDAPTWPESHLGAVPFGIAGTHFSRVIPHLVGARTENGYTLVSPTPLPADLFDDGGIFDEGNYHVFDIALFWADLRANARTRLAAFLASEGQRAELLIETPAVAMATVGQPFHLKPGLRGGPATFDASGLPPGLFLDSITGEIYGTPEVAGIHVLALRATDTASTDMVELVLRIVAERN